MGEEEEEAFTLYIVAINYWVVCMAQANRREIISEASDLSACMVENVG